MLEWLGRAGARWWFVILGVWAVVALAGGVFGAGVFDRTESVEGARGQSARVQERLDELAPDDETVVAVIGGEDFFTPALVESATNVMHDLRTLPGVHEVRDAYTAGGLIAGDKRSSLAVIELDPKLDGDAALVVADRVAAKLRRIDAPEVLVGGKLLAERTFAEQATRDAVRGEAIAFVVLAIVLVLFGGGVLAGAIPLLAALATITGSLVHAAIVRRAAHARSNRAITRAGELVSPFVVEAEIRSALLDNLDASRMSQLLRSLVHAAPPHSPLAYAITDVAITLLNEAPDADDWPATWHAMYTSSGPSRSQLEEVGRAWLADHPSDPSWFTVASSIASHDRPELRPDLRIVLRGSDRRPDPRLCRAAATYIANNREASIAPPLLQALLVVDSSLEYRDLARTRLREHMDHVGWPYV